MLVEATRAACQAITESRVLEYGRRSPNGQVVRRPVQRTERARSWPKKGALSSGAALDASVGPWQAERDVDVLRPA